MPDNQVRMSRADKHSKRKKNQQFLLIFIGLAVLFLVVLFALIFNGGKEKPADKTQAEEILEKQLQEEKTTVSDEPEEQEEEEEEPETEEEEPETEEEVLQMIEPSRENVLEAYTGNWEPIGTAQEGEHVLNFEDGSADRNEIREAVLAVTNIHPDHLNEYWIGYGGEQKVIATVSDLQSSEHYHVYLSWVNDEGWQVTLVERISTLEKRSVNY